MAPLTVFVGAYSDVITTLSFDPAISELKVLHKSKTAKNPSWISTHPTDKSILFASGETGDGRIVLLKIKDDKSLEVLQTAWSGGAGTAHFAVLEDAVVAGNYSSGTLSTIPLQLNPPALLAPSDSPVVFEYPGSGAVPDRQEKSHPHQVYVNGQSLLVPDLGSDKVWKLERPAGSRSFKIVGAITVPPGSGPRHCVVKGDNIYLIDELKSTVSKISLQTSQVETSLSMLTSGKAAEGMLGAEIVLAEATERYPEALIYASNRNDPRPEGDSIAIYTPADSPSGFQLVKEVPTGLNHLRALEFGGAQNRYLFLAGQNGGGIKVFERVEGGRNLKELAHLAEGAVEKPTGFAIL